MPVRPKYVLPYHVDDRLHVVGNTALQPEGLDPHFFYWLYILYKKILFFSSSKVVFISFVYQFEARGPYVTAELDPSAEMD